jgi:hypothetical protein
MVDDSLIVIARAGAEIADFQITEGHVARMLRERV